MQKRKSLRRHLAKDTGLTLLQTMLLVAILGLLATGAASLWLRHAETGAPPAAASDSAETVSENLSR